MGTWEAIQYAGTPLTLMAFIAGVIALGYHRLVTSKIKAIESAPINERSDLVAKLFDTYQMKKDNLTREQKFELMRSVLEHRADRYKVAAIASVIIAMLLCAVVIIAIVFGPEGRTYREGGGPKNATDVSAVMGAVPPVEVLPIDSTSEVVEGTVSVSTVKSQENEDISQILQTLTIKDVSRTATIESVREYVNSPSAETWSEVKYYERDKLEPENRLLAQLIERPLHQLNLKNGTLYTRLISIMDRKAKLSRLLGNIGNPPHTTEQLSLLRRMADDFENAKSEIAQVADGLRSYLIEQGAAKTD